MTRRRAAGAVVLALALVCVWGAGLGGSVAVADTTKRSAKSSGTARSASAACPKRARARSKCRRARVSAGYRRGARGGRALLARPLARAPIGAVAPTASAGGTAGPAGPAGTPVAPVAPGPGATPPPPAPVASSVGAEAYDFGTFVLRLTRASVPAGDLTIYFRNYDVSEHNLWLDAPSAAGGGSQLISAAVGEGGGATKTVPVTPGFWRLYCSLDGHEAMTRGLAVE